MILIEMICRYFYLAIYRLGITEEQWFTEKQKSDACIRTSTKIDVPVSNNETASYSSVTIKKIYKQLLSK